MASERQLQHTPWGVRQPHAHCELGLTTPPRRTNSTLWSISFHILSKELMWLEKKRKKTFQFVKFLP